MATAPTYITHKQFKRIFPQLDEYDQKVQIFGWESLGNSVYVAQDTGLVTALFSDGKELGKEADKANGMGGSLVYKTLLTANIGASYSGDADIYNTFTYNASFTTGSESDLQVGDYIKVDKADGVLTEICYIESVNTGANQITVRRGALGTTAVTVTAAGDNLYIESYLRLNKANLWVYDSYYDQTLIYSASDPNDLLIEAGEDFSGMVAQYTADASRYFDSRVDPSLPREQLKDKSGNYDYMVIRTVGLIAASFMIKTKDHASELAASFMEEVENNLAMLNEGKAALSWQNTSDASQGIIRDIAYTGALRPVDTRGEYSGTWDLIKLDIGTAGAIGTATYNVYVKDADGLKQNQVVTDKKITGDFQPLVAGLEIRFAGAADDSEAVATDEWEIEVTGRQEYVDSSDSKTIKLTRTGTPSRRYYK